MMKRNDGFTLVELIVSIAISTVITGSVLSILLFGMRINAKTADNVKQQNAVNMLSQVVQVVAEEPNIAVHDNQIVFLSVDDEGNIVTDSEGNAVIAQVFVRWVGEDILLNDSVFMEDVTSFTAAMDKSLLTIELTTNEKEYSASVYCRMIPTPDQGGATE